MDFFASVSERWLEPYGMGEQSDSGELSWGSVREPYRRGQELGKKQLQKWEPGAVNGSTGGMNEL